MKRTTIDASREVRLWIGQVIVPAVMTVATIMSIPGAREKISETVASTKTKIKNRFGK